jgi:Flp pilus assembly protein TadB
MTEPLATNSTPATETQPSFREPTPRERRIAAALFVGFGLFFVMLFVVLAGWWFRWVILALAFISIAYSWNHVQQLRRLKRSGGD